MMKKSREVEREGKGVAKMAVNQQSRCVEVKRKKERLTPANYVSLLKYGRTRIGSQDYESLQGE